MMRCVWCNGSDGELRTVTLPVAGRERRTVAVHAAHEAALAAWQARVSSDSQHFVTAMALSPLVVLGAVGFAALVSRGASFVVLGLSMISLAAYMWAHPYATPQTVDLVGVRRSIVLVRVLAVALGLGGALAVVAGFAGYV